MKKDIPVKKNNIYRVSITGMGTKGEGIGKIDNFTIFIPGAILGEEVEVNIIKVNKNYAVGKLLNIIIASEERVKPICDIYTRCGGCQLQHMSYKEQLNFKRQKVKDALLRLGGIDVEVEAVLGMKNPYRYRNKVQLPIGKENEKVSIGFYAPRSHNIIDLKTCLIQDEKADDIIKILREWIEKFNVPIYNEKEHKGNLRHIMVRTAFKTGEVMVVLVTKDKNLPHKEELINKLIENLQGVVSIIQNINSQKTNVVLGKESIVLWGKDKIIDYIANFKFAITPLSFFQVNPIQTEVLYNKALEYADLKGNEVVFDAYCGTGTISLFLSQKAKKVYGVEIVAEAIESAKLNAKENNVDNVDFIVGESEQVIPELIEKGIKADVVVVDPPRKGCEKSLLEAMANMSPEKIVYVSCDPATLARDLGVLEKLGYKTIRVQPVDMFSNTYHVENVVLLEKF
ncbi:23S rRNA (uracil(1939)-C(5))-methyltransferase RlmD [Clostridium cochlearium]|jgi:23S rRNA (uracil1939-C5)-methyltransferase|uniref:23S rRNA (uracil(1939)-C(5))-methyltransferase RlmD n=1 Tax=Clostridium cochlearium TaxID=1494 RepID=UPI000B946E7C|nr:23S rRNA (uracil(1939)-C(5))-methyltransferase RlmD [Clostridium cochlearium]SNV88327.1 tRNA (uracil-5-) -methyltransferase [Clostridium cochlearium]STA93659.1 tRNA (uracil-5-) -methyltransferase [Clostridium cochlearium]